MKKRVCAALITLLLTGGLACPPALAEAPPPPLADSGTGEQTPPAAPDPDGELPPVPPEGGPEAGGGGEPCPPEEDGAQPPEPPPGELPPEAPPVPPEEDGCDTMEALAEWVARAGGGAVTVTGDLSMPEGETMRLVAGQPVTIDLGPHSITVPEGANLTLSGPITLRGDGAPGPLLAVSGFLTTENGAALSASGENAVAVRLTGGGWSTTRASVEAVGADACAVEADTPLDLYRLHLSARGENAVCVRATAPVRLILCQAESDGALADAPALTLDGTAASPEPEDARVIRREAGPGDALSENGLCIPVGASEEELAELLGNRLGGAIYYSLYDEAAEEYAILESVEGTWSGEPVELSRPGAWRFTGTPAAPLGNVQLPERMVWLYVLEPGVPWIMDAERGKDSAVLRFFQKIEGAESLILWYSLDGGESWRDAAQLPGTSIQGEGALLAPLPAENCDYSFQLEVRGGPMAGKSNVLPFACYDNRHWNGGGDWDGGDWGDQGELPEDDPAPPPDREPDGEPAPAPPTGDNPPEPDREDAGDDPDPGDQPPAIPAPAPAPGLPDIEASLVEPAPGPIHRGAAPPVVTAGQPAPPRPVDPAPSPAPPEPAPGGGADTILPEGATAALTGRDLEAQKRANPGGVTLAGSGLKVTLPYALTDALSLGAEDVLAVRLAMPDPASFEIRFWADGQEVADFGGAAFTITVPVGEGEGAADRCVAPDGREIAASAIAEERAEFELTATGVYTLAGARAPAPAPEPEETPPPIRPLLWGAAALVGAYLLAWRRRGGR